jgi:hypothetical protein
LSMAKSENCSIGKLERARYGKVTHGLRHGAVTQRVMAEYWSNVRRCTSRWAAVLRNWGNSVVVIRGEANKECGLVLLLDAVVY